MSLFSVAAFCEEKLDSSFRPCCIWLAVVAGLARASQTVSRSNTVTESTFVTPTFKGRPARCKRLFRPPLLCSHWLVYRGRSFFLLMSVGPNISNYWGEKSKRTFGTAPLTRKTGTDEFTWAPSDSGELLMFSGLAAYFLQVNK